MSTLEAKKISYEVCHRGTSVSRLSKVLKDLVVDDVWRVQSPQEVHVVELWEGHPVRLHQVGQARRKFENILQGIRISQII